MSATKMKKKILLSSVILMLSFSLFVFVTYAWFTGLFQESFTGEVGFVQADLNAYFDDGLGGQVTAQEVVIESSNSATATDVSFANSTSTIASSTIDLSVYSAGDKIRIAGSTSNDGIYLVTGTPTANSLVVTESLTNESAGSSVTTDKVISKPGVYYVNIVSSSLQSYFEDFRLSIDVYSNIDTYLRIRVIEQLTLLYTDYTGQETELSILTNDYMPFNYDLVNWRDNRILDTYMYYKVPSQRTNETTPLEIALIIAAPSATDVSFSNATSTISSSSLNFLNYSDGDEIRVSGSTSNDGNYAVVGTPTANSLVVNKSLTNESAGATVTIGRDFATYQPGYSLQIAFSIEAVQADGGPENVWNLTTPPWGGSW